MGRGKYKSKPTGLRQFSTPEDMLAGFSTRPRSFRQVEAEHKEEEEEEESEDGSELQESGEDYSDEGADKPSKRKGAQGIIEIENPNLVNPKTSLKARDIDMAGKTTTQLSRREREEIEKQKAHEQGKTDQAKKDLERLTLIRQQRAEAAKKREEQKAAKEQRAEAAAKKREEEEKAAKEQKRLKARK